MTSHLTLFTVYPSFPIGTVALRVTVSRDDALSLAFGVSSVARVVATGASRSEPALVANTARSITMLCYWTIFYGTMLKFIKSN